MEHDINFQVKIKTCLSSIQLWIFPIDWRKKKERKRKEKMGTDTLAYTYALVVLVGGIAGYLKSGKDLINIMLS